VSTPSVIFRTDKVRIVAVEKVENGNVWALERMAKDALGCPAWVHVHNFYADSAHPEGLAARFTLWIIEGLQRHHDKAEAIGGSGP
jgi:hypothetical protein